MDYSQAARIIGLVLLLAFSFYALRLVASFRTGMLAKSWKSITIGAIFLILAQLPLLIADFSSAEGDSVLIVLGTSMRFAGVIFLTIGLRVQCRVWLLERKNVPEWNVSNKYIER